GREGGRPPGAHRPPPFGVLSIANAVGAVQVALYARGSPAVLRLRNRDDPTSLAAFAAKRGAGRAQPTSAPLGRAGAQRDRPRLPLQSCLVRPCDPGLVPIQSGTRDSLPRC